MRILLILTTTAFLVTALGGCDQGRKTSTGPDPQQEQRRREGQSIQMEKTQSSPATPAATGTKTP